jgi:hypothetical protein
MVSLIISCALTEHIVLIFMVPFCQLLLLLLVLLTGGGDGIDPDHVPWVALFFIGLPLEGFPYSCLTGLVLNRVLPPPCCSWVFASAPL